MSDKTYRLKIFNQDEGWKCNGFVGQSVVDKINKKEFVEFNLLVKYSSENGEEDTSHYIRHHYSPNQNSIVEIEEVTAEEVMEQCLN